jgi:hypothetical protein
LCYESTEEVIVFSIFHDMHIYFHVCYTKASLSCPLDWKLPVTGTQNLLFLGHTPSLLGPTNQLKAGTLSSTHFLSVSSALSHSLQLSLCVCVCVCECVCVCVCVCVVLTFELRAYTLSHSLSPFLWFFFQDRVLQTIC